MDDKPSSSSLNTLSLHQPSNSSDKQKRKNAKNAAKSTAKRNKIHDADRQKILCKLHIQFGLSLDTKIIIADEHHQIDLTYGKIAVLNSEGTQLICSVGFHHLTANPQPEKQQLQLCSSSSGSRHQFESSNFNINDDIDQHILDTRINLLETYLSSVKMDHHFISNNLSQTFPILYHHAISRYPVKNN